MKEHRQEHKKRIDIVTIKAVKEGSISYLPRNISSPKDCVNLIKSYIGEVDREVFIVIALDTKNQPTAIHTVSIGTLNSAIVHPREVYKMAILANASSIILAHNHPSGISKPSKEDISLTERLADAGKLMGINVLDHVIIGDEEYTSFKEKAII